MLLNYTVHSNGLLSSWFIRVGIGIYFTFRVRLDIKMSSDNKTGAGVEMEEGMMFCHKKKKKNSLT